MINFNQSAYDVNENDSPAQPVLILSNPSVFDITLQIRDINIDLSGIIAYSISVNNSFDIVLFR